MAVYIGAVPWKPEQASIIHPVWSQVTFDTPADFVYYLEHHEGVKREVLNGEWSWVE